MADLPSDETVEVIVRDSTTSDYELKVNKTGSINSANIVEFLTRQGKVFTNIVLHSFSSTVLLPKLLIENPSGSSVDLFIHELYVYPQLASTTAQLNQFSVGIFANPTVTANGTLVTSYNTRIGSSNTSQVNIYHSPTISDFGSLIAGSVAINDQTSNRQFILEPGNSAVVYVAVNDISNSAATILKFSEVEL